MLRNEVRRDKMSRKSVIGSDSMIQKKDAEGEKDRYESAMTKDRTVKLT